MKRIFFCAFLCVAFISTNSKAQGRDVEVVDGMTWYLTKKDAIDVAREEGKYIFFMWGRSVCHRCDEFKKDAAWCFLKPIIDKHYVLWYSDGDKYDRDSPEVSDYFSSLPKGIVPQPVLCVIDPSDPTKAYGIRTGAYDIDDLTAMLEQYVSNDYISDTEKVFVYVSGNNLVIQGDFKEEVIYVYSVTGTLVDQFIKEEYSFYRSLSAYPKGILFINSSSGWTRKIVVK